MLVLTRQRDQAVMIGDDIQVTLLDVRGDKVRLGIEAPKRVPVHRKEVWEQIKRENEDAARIQPADLAGLSSAHVTPAESAARRFPRLAAGKSDPFLEAALEEARLGLSEGGLPIGSVLVRGDKIIGRGHNRRVQRGDPMAHAEIDCLTNAGRQKTYRDTVLYSTLMPCYLCSGAAVQFGIPKVIVGESANFPGAPNFMRSKGIEVLDLQDHDCTTLMADFVARHPELWNEDIGK